LNRKFVIAVLAALVLAVVRLAHAQEPKPYRVGVLHEGGPTFDAAVDGLKRGLQELGFIENKHYVLAIHDLKGDPKAIEEAAKRLEREKVDLIFIVGTSVAKVVHRATTAVPLVFAAGADPVAGGLIDSYSKPGGRITGVHYWSVELMAKRLEVLRAMLPGIRKVITFYNPRNEFALKSAGEARTAARQLGIELVERQVASVEALRADLLALKPQDADAYVYTADAMTLSQAQFIIDTAKAKKLPTMFGDSSLVQHGALLAYGVSYREAGRLSAKYVQRILTGTSPRNLPAESLSKVGLAVNLLTAREIGITIPQSLLLRADEVIQ
jgi:putative ABC transport system substrate-binding protein